MSGRRAALRIPVILAGMGFTASLLGGCDSVNDLLFGTKSSRDPVSVSSSLRVSSIPPSLCPPNAGGISTVSPASGKSPAVPGSGALSPTASPGDPLYPFQWHLQNTGQAAFSDTASVAGSDIRQLTSQYTGLGIKIAIVDTGLELAHEDLQPNVVPGASANFNTNGNDPSPVTGGLAAEKCLDHGTSVAGLAAARAGNEFGGRGVAGMASLVGYNFLSSNESTAMQIASLGGAAYAADVDVFNQSYGCTICELDPAVEAQYLYGVTNLRGGNGGLYVKSAGNDFSSSDLLSCGSAKSAGLVCGNANLDAENAIPYQVVAGALSARGIANLASPFAKASYASTGASLWISAPGGEFGASNQVVSCGGAPCTGIVIEPALVTTDLMGCLRGAAMDTFNNETTINTFDFKPHTSNAGCNYTSTFNGTSSAAPIVSGAVALLLQANPKLTWRDVKHILAKTAVPVDPGMPATKVAACGSYVAEPAWTAKKAGFNFHNWYGFGRIDVDAAVAMATSAPYSPYTVSWGAWTVPSYTSSAFASPQAIPDCSSTGFTHVLIPPAVAFIEAVQIKPSFTHTDGGQVGIELTNLATGTVSVLLNPANGLSGQPGSGSILLLTNAFYGEASNGGTGTTAGFRLRVVDVVSGGTGTLDQWSIRVYGH